MRVENVCAVVVTFHPDPGIAGRLGALLQQFGGLVVVDNGSSAEQLQPVQETLVQETLLHNAQADPSLRILLQNDRNLGIATALNVGIRWAARQGFSHVVLFDQDSHVTEGLLPAMIACWQGSPWGPRLAILVPRYLDSRLEVPIPPNRVPEGLEAAMTSGSMVAVSLFDRLGYFVDELFIDGVDYEFSLRARAAGMVIAECEDAILRHSPGEPRVVRWRGRRLYQTANYSPLRRYYQERNKVWISLRYFRQFPVFSAKLFLFSAKDLVKILVAEPNPAQKARYFLRGLWHGLRGRTGRLG